MLRWVNEGKVEDNREFEVWIEGFGVSSKHSFWHSIRRKGAWTHSGEESWFQGEVPQGGRRTGTGVDTCACACRCWRSLIRKEYSAISRCRGPIKGLTDWTLTTILNQRMRVKVSESQIQKQAWSPSGSF
jgi:hypothetical protein